MISREEATGLLSFGLLVMVVTHALVHAAGNIQSTIFPVLKEEFSLTNQQIGLMASIPLLCQALLTIPTGMLSDKFGAKKMIALSICMGALGAFLASMTQNPLMYIMAATLLTLNTTFYHPPSFAYTTSISNPKNRPLALGILNAGGTFGMSLGPLSIPILMGVFALGWRQVYFFWVIPILLGLIALYFVKSEPASGAVEDVERDMSEPVESSSLLSASMILFLVSSGIRRFGGSMTTAFLSIYLVEARDWSLASLGLILGASSFMGVIGSPLGGTLASRFGEKRWAVISLLSSYTCFILAFLVKGVAPFTFLYLSYRFFGTLCMPATQAITVKLSPRRQRGLGFALSFLPGSMVGAVAPIVAAAIADSLGMSTIFMASTVIFFAGLGVLQFGVKVD